MSDDPTEPASVVTRRLDLNQVRDSAAAGDADRPSGTADTPALGPSDRARVCPSCGSFNLLHREICHHCGVDVATGGSLPWPDPDPEPAVILSRITDAPHPRRWWLPVAAVLAASGALLLGLVLAQVGPFNDGPSVPDAPFEASFYAAEPGNLLLTDVATISTRPPEGDRVFVAGRMADHDPETAWRSDGLQNGDPEQPLEIIDLFLAEPAWIDSLVLRNGDQRDPADYEAEGRIRQVRATFDGGESYLLNLLDEGRGQQVVELPEPLLTTSVRLEVLDIFLGLESDGVGVSDLDLTGWSASTSDAALAQRRADALPATG